MKLICGVDEAGRGPLAGPVFAAAVILDSSRPIEGIADSKKLTPGRREELAGEIRARAVAWAVASSSVEEIDSINILQASLLAMRRAVESLKVVPGQVLVDGLHCPRVNLPVRAVVRGDSKVEEIAAASILAKVSRDEAMLALHRDLPQYGFDRHKGYPTRAHLEALRAYGPSIVHRRSFEPVRMVMGVAEPRA
jgi:ribonuclease HII